ncbi:Gfo/Idh/MocA family oxidoreductase [Nocardia sp. CA-120079]|uniref:Gfo/Idh/MocA family oxidoreductase n=1 Tax=Nocardia sp. CA-120079 TaxID=3239974 RepID=UPI003D95C413
MRLPEVDLVVVSVKASGHAAVIREALAAGKHVVSEWPLGVDADEAGELTEADHWRDRVAQATGASW